MWTLLIACGLPPPLPVDDADDDGVSTGEGDCDDHAEDVFPGAVEICNEVDDDCDGTIDLGVCREWAFEDEVASIRGEDGLGEVLRPGRFDGDAVTDLLTSATIGGSTAVCLAGGVRVGGGHNQALANVANCWVTAPSTINPVVVSADRFGQDLPVGQHMAIVPSGTNLCAVDPFARSFTLEEAAYGCISLDELPPETQVGLRLAPADFDRGTIAASSAEYLGILDPIDYLAGAPPEPAVIEFPSRIAAVDNAGDLDGDGVTDVLVAVADRAYIVRGNTDLTGPVELITPYFVDAAQDISALGGLGDLDGDGTREWMTVSPVGTEVWSLTSAFSTVYSASQGLAPAGDFDGDGRDDAWARINIDETTSVVALQLGSSWPATLDLWDGPALMTVAAAGDFGRAFASAGDADGDGFADTWVSAPDWTEDEIVVGRLFRFDGWPIDGADPDGIETETPVD